jgi:hypothetical protein
VEKSIDYYMNLNYTVELEGPYGHTFQASLKEMPECKVSARASESLEELWSRLREVQRDRIGGLLCLGQEVPEPPSEDPFGQIFPPGVKENLARQYFEYGASIFTLRTLIKRGLQELQDAGLTEVVSPGIPPKGRADQSNQTVHTLKGDLRPVRLGESLKGAWVRFDGPRTSNGYRGIEILDQPLPTEAAIVAALTIRECTTIEDFDFEKLREMMLDHVAASTELEGKYLHEVLDTLGTGWFATQKAIIDEEIRLTDEEIQRLPTGEEKKRRLRDWKKRKPKRRRGEPQPRLWRRSLNYMVALLRYRRPDFDDQTFEEQLELLNRHRRRINEFLEKQSQHMAFLEYGTTEGLPRRAVELARDQVRAAVLADVEGLRHYDIATKLGLKVPEDRYDVDKKIPQVADLARDGRLLLDQALREGSWQSKAEEMKAEAERYKSLSDDEKWIEALAENTGMTIEGAKRLLPYRSRRR